MVRTSIQCVDGDALILIWQFERLMEMRVEQRRLITTDNPGPSVFDGTQEELKKLVGAMVAL